MWLWNLFLPKNVTKIVSWNVNSIRVRLEHLNTLIEESNPDIIMLQETKSTNEDFPYDVIRDQGYRINIPADYFGHVFGEKEVPQPHDAAAFGLLILKEDSISLFS